MPGPLSNSDHATELRIPRVEIAGPTGSHTIKREPRGDIYVDVDRPAERFVSA